jgi:hypothetical protein
MSLLKGKYVENDTLEGSKIRLNNNQSLRARNAANNADVELLKVNASDVIEFASTPKIGANDLLDASQLGVANGIATLDANGLVPSNQLPSYVDDVLEFADLASFPGTGETGKIYVAIDTGKTYRWSGTVYVEISPSDVNSVNGAVGAVVLDTDDIDEGAANFYYTEGRFDTSLAGKSTTDLSEGTNLYFTEARVRSTPLTGYVVGANSAIAATDSVLGAFEKVQGQINALSSASVNAEVESITVSATDITNGYVVLANTPTKVLSVSPKGGLVQEPTVDYTVTTNQVAWAGDLASVIAEGDKLIISYVY